MFIIESKINPDKLSESKLLRIRVHLEIAYLNIRNKKYSNVVFNIKGILREFKPNKKVIKDRI